MLPDLCLLPSHIQEKVFFLCALSSQAALAQTAHCFRLLWHRPLPPHEGAKPEPTLRETWHKQQMISTAQRLRGAFISQIVKKPIHRAPAAYGSSTLHMSVQGHLTQHQLAYIFQLPLPSAQLLGAQLGGMVFSDAAWPDRNWAAGNLGASMFLSLKLSCRRQAVLTADELEHLEAVFCALPNSFATWTCENELQDLWLACEPMWQCSTSPSAPAAMQWRVPADLLCFTADAADLIV